VRASHGRPSQDHVAASTDLQGALLVDKDGNVEAEFNFDGIVISHSPQNLQGCPAHIDFIASCHQ
jgi:hypothetical protein